MWRWWEGPTAASSPATSWGSTGCGWWRLAGAGASDAHCFCVQLLALPCRRWQLHWQKCCACCASVAVPVATTKRCHCMPQERFKCAVLRNPVCDISLMIHGAAPHAFYFFLWWGGSRGSGRPRARMRCSCWAPPVHRPAPSACGAAPRIAPLRPSLACTRSPAPHLSCSERHTRLVLHRGVGHAGGAAAGGGAPHSRGRAALLGGVAHRARGQGAAGFPVLQGLG